MGTLDVLEHAAAAVRVPQVPRPVVLGPFAAGPAGPLVSLPGPNMRRDLVWSPLRLSGGGFLFAMGEEVLDRMCREACRYPVELSDLP